MASEVSKGDLTSSDDTTAAVEEPQLTSESTVTSAVGEDSSHSKTQDSSSTIDLNQVGEVLVDEAASVLISGEQSLKEIASECNPQTVATKVLIKDSGETTNVPIIKIESVGESNVPGTLNVEIEPVQISSELNAEGVDENTAATSGDLINSPSTIPVEDTVTADTNSESTNQNVTAGVSEDPVDTSFEQPLDQAICCPEYRGLVGYLRISMMYFRESVYLLPFQFLLLGLPISAGFMGARYMRSCPASPAIPVLLFMMGITGTITILSRMYIIFRKALFPHDVTPREAKNIITIGLILLVVMFGAELLSFWKFTPSFTDGYGNYCPRTFYYFLYYANYGSFFLIGLVLILHCPGSRVFSRIRTPEVELPLI